MSEPLAVPWPTTGRRALHTVLVCTTRGEVREAELREAYRILGVREVRFLGYRGSGMQGTPENQDRAR